MKPYKSMMRINLIHNGFSIPHDLDLDDVLSTWIEHDKGKDIYVVAFYGGGKYEVDINTYYDIQRYLNKERGDDATGAF